MPLRTWKEVGAITFVVLVATWHILPVLQNVVAQWNHSIPPTWTHSGSTFDPDTFLIHNGLLAAPHFRDTLRWWTGVWVGQVPFYRPLSSLIFWIEWKLLGEHEPRFVLFSLLFHLLAVYQFTRLALSLFAHFRCPFPYLAAITAGVIFVDGLDLVAQSAAILVGPTYASGLCLFPERLTTTGMVAGWWKNQPDSLCTLFCCLALRRYIAAVEEGGARNNSQRDAAPRITGKRRISDALRRANWGSLPIAVGAFVAGCLCKEAGVLLPLALIWLEWRALFLSQRADRRTAQKRLGSMLLIIPLFLLIRSLCLRGTVGFQYGSNRSWSFRLLNNVGGPALEAVSMHNWPALQLGCVLLAVTLAICWGRSRRMSLPALVFLIVGAIGALAVIGGASLSSETGSSIMARALVHEKPVYGGSFPTV